MRIEGVGRIGIGAVRRQPRESAQQSRALTAVAPARARDPAAFSALLRPDAAVVVQLFAVRDSHPQQRERRRAEPAVASAAYAATARGRRPPARLVVDLVA